MKRKRVLVIGLDGAAPQLVFGEWPEELPHLRQLMATGVYGELESTIPPITCPAWMSMMTSKDPGQLGVYGFRDRADYSYRHRRLVTSRAFREPAVWDILSRWGRRVILIGVPPSYPPRPVHGDLVACFMTPNADCPYTYPPELKQEVERVVGRYLFDVEGFRSRRKEHILQQLYDMAERRFTLLRHLMCTRAWDFCMMVEIGVDRLHHGFWSDFDPEHPRYRPGSSFVHAVKDYYVFIDAQIGETLALIDDHTTVLVVSDHGAQRLDGSICINEWLIREGYLTLKQRPHQVTAFDNVEVDWEKTMVWGEGGYDGRLFLNVRGREPRGIVDPSDYERVRDELAEKLRALEDPHGRTINTRVFKPETIYKQCRGISPDVIVYFGDLHWRAVGSVGHATVWACEDEAGPNEANHAQHGIFIMSPTAERPGTHLAGIHLMDCAPTILHRLGVPVPPDMEGKVIP